MRQVAVTAAWQGRGVGRDLVRACEAYVAALDLASKANKAFAGSTVEGEASAGSTVEGEAFAGSTVEGEAFAKTSPATALYCHARLTAEPFYSSCGWRPVGEGFTEVGIPHVKMVAPVRSE